MGPPMTDVSGVQNPNPLAALQGAPHAVPQGAPRTLRVTPAGPSAVRTTQRTDVISFTKAAQQVSASRATQSAAPTYGLSGLQATTPTAAQREMGKLVAARVDAPMDYVSGQVTGRNGSLPFYTNPALANSAATSTNAARLGTSIDTTG